MPILNTGYITILGAFARLFSKRIWEHARILLIGAILSPAERTVRAALRAWKQAIFRLFHILCQFFQKALNLFFAQIAFGGALRAGPSTPPQRARRF